MFWYNADRVAVIGQKPGSVLDYYRYRIGIILILLFFCHSFYYSQQRQSSKVKIIGTLGIPLTVTSAKFSTCFKGLYEASLSGNVKLKKPFYIGAGIQNSWFDNNKLIFKTQYSNGNVPYKTTLLINSGFLKFSYDKFFSEIGFVSYCISGGYSFAKYNNVVADTTLANRPYGITTFNAPFAQPEISLNFFVEKSLGFSVLLNYTTMFSKFDPKAPRFNHFQEVRDEPNNYFSGWVTFGFAFNIYLD